MLPALLALTLAWPPLLADVAPDAPPPIELDSCEYVHNQALTRFGLRVHYVNTSGVAATMVRFHVTWGDGGSMYLRDVGTFAPDVTIAHTFPGPSSELYGFNFRCGVTSARFADGTNRTAPVEEQ